ncbi:DUF4166 domain-containing protein [Peribacillus frigoritolerans]|nr:DUF4166 domain-containing protein [Peribacillus frigoritolerans]
MRIFQRLHPKLQERYALPIDKPFNGVGTMSKIETGAFWLKPFFKISNTLEISFSRKREGCAVFRSKNTCRSLPTGEAEIYWERTFLFEEITRHFNAFMTVDTKRRVVKDYLGEPSLFYSDLKFVVTPEGRINIRSGPQRIVIGNLEFPILRLLEGVVTVEEGYDDAREVFTIQVDIRNRIVGRLMAYEGEFKVQTV